MPDRLLARIVVSALALVTLIGLGLLGWLAVIEKPIPDGLIAIPTAALGALGGLLTRLDGDTTTVEQAGTVNTGAQPVDGEL
jgi:hypothetical protein